MILRDSTGAGPLALHLGQATQLISFNPTAADPELPHHRSESTEEKKQTKGSEKHGEAHDEV